jgi:hypothetical protein
MASATAEKEEGIIHEVNHDPPLGGIKKPFAAIMLLILTSFSFAFPFCVSPSMPNLSVLLDENYVLPFIFLLIERFNS